MADKEQAKLHKAAIDCLMGLGSGTMWLKERLYRLVLL